MHAPPVQPWTRNPTSFYGFQRTSLKVTSCVWLALKPAEMSRCRSASAIRPCRRQQGVHHARDKPPLHATAITTKPCRLRNSVKSANPRRTSSEHDLFSSRLETSVGARVAWTNDSGAYRQRGSLGMRGHGGGGSVRAGHRRRMRGLLVHSHGNHLCAAQTRLVGCHRRDRRAVMLSLWLACCPDRA